MIERVQRTITMTRGGTSYPSIKTVTRVNQRYIVASSEVKNWGIDSYGHAPMWLVFNDDATNLIKGGFETKGEAIRYAENL